MKIIDWKKYYTIDEAMQNTSKSILVTANELAIELRKAKENTHNNLIIHV
jgi:hypothetical protein